MREPKKVILTFLPKTSFKTVYKDVTKLIQKFDAEIPQFKDLEIVLITSLEISHCKKISHPRVRATVCGAYFSPKKDVQYILIQNGYPKELAQVTRAMGQKKQTPIKVFEIKDGKIVEVAA